MNFEIVFEDDFLNICLDESFKPINNKNVLLNDTKKVIGGIVSFIILYGIL